MRIAQVSPLTESVPPPKYGGTERVVSYLTEELVRQGHDVTLFASGDSVTTAKLVAGCPKALRTDPSCVDPLAWHLIQIEQVARMAAEFDVVHFHCDYAHLPVMTRMQMPFLTTLHGRLDIPEFRAVHTAYPGVPLISISNSQRAPVADLNWRATVYHGLPENYGECDPAGGKYLVFVGRVSPEKRVDRAIEIAIRADIPIKVGAKVDRADQDYFDQKIKHLLDHPLVEFIGEVGEDEKKALWSEAIAMLFPIDWPEPFGLVMIEAMAHGVPVIAFPCGSVPEIIDHGTTGYVVDSIDDAVKAVHSAQSLNRQYCRQAFAARFTAGRMARDYVAEYERLVEFAHPHRVPVRLREGHSV